MVKYMEPPFKRFVCSYSYQGQKWVVDVMAQDFEDAARRLQAISLGKVDGIHVMTIPARLSLLGRVLVWLRNCLRLPP